MASVPTTSVVAASALLFWCHDRCLDIQLNVRLCVCSKWKARYDLTFKRGRKAYMRNELNRWPTSSPHTTGPVLTWMKGHDIVPLLIHAISLLSNK